MMLSIKKCLCLNTCWLQTEFVYFAWFRKESLVHLGSNDLVNLKTKPCSLYLKELGLADYPQEKDI